MCGLRTRPRRTDVDPPRFLYRTAIGRGHIVSLPRGDSLSVIFIADLYQSSKIKFVSDLFQIGGSAFVFFDILLKWAEPISLQISDLVSVRDLLTLSLGAYVTVTGISRKFHQHCAKPVASIPGVRGVRLPPIKIYSGESIFSPPQSFS